MQTILIQEEQKFHTLCQMALHFIRKDECKNLKIMLQSGLNVNFKAYEKQTLLMLAANHNSLACAKMLLQEGALVDECDTRGITPLMEAYYKGYVKMVKLLLDYGANPNINDAGIAFYMLAILSGKWQIVELLLKYSDISLSKRISLMILHSIKGNLDFKLPYQHHKIL